MNKQTPILILALLLQVTLWLLHPKPFIASDPLGYAQHAHAIASGTFFVSPPEHIFAHRLGVTLPVAGLYKLFGVSPVTTHLAPLLASLLTTCLIWFACPRGIARGAAVLLLALSLPQLESAAQLYPDIILSLLMLAAVFGISVRGKPRSLWGSLLVASVAALLLASAFVTKATAVWTLPFVAAVCIYDAWTRRPLLVRFWLPFTLSLVVLGGLYLLLSQALWGSVWARLESLASVSAQHQWSYAERPMIALFRRVTTDALQFLNGRFIPVFALSVGGLVLCPARLRFWAGYYVTVLALFWFGSASLSSYDPLPLIPRMVLPALPPMCIMAAAFVASVWPLQENANPRSARRLVSISVVAVLLVAAGGSWIGKELGLVVAATTIVAAALLVVVLLARSQRHGLKTLSLVALVAMVSVPAFAGVLQWRHIPVWERHAMNMLKQTLSTTDGRVLLLCADQRSPGALVCYFGFHYPEQLTVEYLGADKRPESESFERVFLFRHSARARFLHDAYGLPLLDAQFDSLAVVPCLYDRAGVQLCEAAR